MIIIKKWTVESKNILCNDGTLNFQIVQKHLNFLLQPSIQQKKTTLSILGIFG